MSTQTLLGCGTNCFTKRKSSSQIAGRAHTDVSPEGSHTTPHRPGTRSWAQIPGTSSHRPLRSRHQLQEKSTHKEAAAQSYSMGSRKEQPGYKCSLCTAIRVLNFCRPDLDKYIYKFCSLRMEVARREVVWTFIHTCDVHMGLPCLLTGSDCTCII